MNRGSRSLRILGAIIAGGKARRFGSDKANAVYRGERLIDRVAKSLSLQSDALVVCGREEPSLVCIPDCPEPDLGPLGGLNAALRHAADHGYTHVLSAGCDIPNLPEDLADILQGQGPAIAQSQPVVGLWPSELSAELAEYLAGGQRALYGFAELVKARKQRFDPPLMNINSPEDLPKT